MTDFIQAKIENLNAIIPLFHAYRSFYRHPVDQKAEVYLKERLEKNDSVIFLAMNDLMPIGFMQLYPSFSSRGLGKIWILNDLYIIPEFRRKKIAWKLIEKAVEYSKSTNAISLNLSTEISNTNAQELYKKFGFKKDNDFFYFNLKV